MASKPVHHITYQPTYSENIITQHFVAKTLREVTLDTANADQKAVLETALKQVGFIPNMYTNMVNVPGVLTTYLHGYSGFRQNSEGSLCR